MIILNKDSSIMIQGMTGREGSFQTKLMKEYGTKVVCGVTPGREGASVEGLPVYDTVRKAIAEHPDVSVSVVFVPPAHCRSAVLEAMDSGLRWVIAITEGMPVKDTMWLVNYAKYKGSHIIGPNCPGVIVPGVAKAGIIPGSAFAPGSIGLISRSGTLTYEVGNALKSRQLGVSTAVGVGGDPIVGMTLLDICLMFEEDPDTMALVVLGEIGGSMEEDLALALEMGIIRKPIVSFIAGVTAPPGKRMGHAGAILQPGGSSAIDKLNRMKSAGAHIAGTPWDIPAMVEGLI